MQPPKRNETLRGPPGCSCNDSCTCGPSAESNAADEATTVALRFFEDPFGGIDNVDFRLCYLFLLSEGLRAAIDEHISASPHFHRFFLL